jgi:hypothetical protein
MKYAHWRTAEVLENEWGKALGFQSEGELNVRDSIRRAA